MKHFRKNIIRNIFFYTSYLARRVVIHMIQREHLWVDISCNATSAVPVLPRFWKPTWAEVTPKKKFLFNNPKTLWTSTLSSQHLMIQSQQWKHQYNAWNLFKIRHGSGVFIVNLCFHCWPWTSKYRLSNCKTQIPFNHTGIALVNCKCSNTKVKLKGTFTRQWKILLHY